MEPGDSSCTPCILSTQDGSFLFFPAKKLSLILLFFSRTALAYAILKKFEKYPLFPILKERIGWSTDSSPLSV